MFKSHHLNNGLLCCGVQQTIVLTCPKFASLQVRRREADGSGSGALDVRSIDFEV